MGSFPIRPFQESKPQNGDSDKFPSKRRRKTKISPSIKNFNSYGLQKASIYNSAINEEKSWQRYVMDILEAKEEIFMAK